MQEGKKASWFMVQSTKVVQDGGRGAKNGLDCSNEFPISECGRIACQMCLQQKDGVRTVHCDKESFGHGGGECTQSPARSFAYIGESSK